MKGHIFSVSEVNLYLKAVMEADPKLTLIYIRGEISNFKCHTSGHLYLTLKDDTGVLRSVMFKSDARKLKFQPENGMKVIAKGRISVFPRDGQYQLYINDMIPDGVGALYVAFEQLKKKLGAEGLFDPERKQALPRYPGRIALVTSPTGAAVRDMLRILKARYPVAKVLICPVLVQGPEAPADLCRMIAWLNERDLCDVIICGRGGGSLEDLWAFNDENVARVIAASHIPVISAVGHEPDVTISDFVADLRAATPSNAAELVVPDRIAIKNGLMELQLRMLQNLRSRLQMYREYLKNTAKKPVMESPLNYFQDKRLLIDYTTGRLAAAMQRVLSGDRERFARLAAALDAMSPLKVLGRGYSIVANSAGKVVRSYQQVQLGEHIHLRLEKGSIDCVVEDIFKK